MIAVGIRPIPLDEPTDGARAQEGPAVLRLRMLEVGQTLRFRALDEAARADAEAALAALRNAVLTRPAASLADALARARTRADAALASDRS